MNVRLDDCRNVILDSNGTIIYCIHCRRITGYVDENRIAHLHNVRLLQYEPVVMNKIGNQHVQFMKVFEFIPKRKYSIDILDLLGEPPFKKPRTETTVMRVAENNNVLPLDPIFEEDEDEFMNEFEDGEFWNDANFVTSTPGRMPSSPLEYNHHV